MDDPFVKWINTYDPNAALHPQHLRAAWDAATLAERGRCHTIVMTTFVPIVYAGDSDRTTYAAACVGEFGIKVADLILAEGQTK